MAENRRVLIVGGDPGSDEIRALEEIGYVVDVAASAEDAATRLTTSDYARVVIDPTTLVSLGEANLSAEVAACSLPAEPPSGEVEWQMMLADIVANSTEASLAYLDPGFIFIWVNAAYAERLGYAKDDIIGRNYSDIFPDPEDIRILERVRDTGLPYVANEKPLVDHRKPNNVSYWNWNLIPIRRRNDPVGTTRGFTITQVDVTRDVQARKYIEQLREGAEKQAQEMTAVFEAMTDAVTVYDEKGVITYANPTAMSVYGIDPTNTDRDSLRQMRAVKTSDGKLVQLEELPSSRALRGETVVDEQLVIVNVQGNEMIVLVSVSPITTEGRVLGAVALWHDITQLKQAEIREQLMEKHKREFYRKTILAATNGKLVVTEKEEIVKLAGPSQKSWEIVGFSDLATVRSEATKRVEAAGMDGERFFAFISCLGESTSNAVKHAKDVTASIHRLDDGFLFMVSDRGSGIDALNLPDVALIRGYSTAGTGGFGYNLMIACSDKVYLATGPEGTTVAFRVKMP